MAYYLEQWTVKFCTSYPAFQYAATLGATQGMQKMYDLVGATSPGFVCSTRYLQFQWILIIFSMKGVRYFQYPLEYDEYEHI